MCLSGLMISKTKIKYSKPGSFPGGEVTNLPFNFFEDSNKEIMGGEQKEEVL